MTAAEAGQKLLQFLSRRFEEPQSVLHRWIRTGQVRINGGRAKPFDRVELNDEIRVPPFAGAGTKAERVPASSGGKELPPIVAETADVIVFCKPSGLPVHPGTGHTDSLTTRLEAAFAGSPFIPAPVHRLDRDTSGLLLVGKTYAAVRRLSDALAAHDGSVAKDYLAWVQGECPWSRPKRLEDHLAKRTVGAQGREKVVAGNPHGWARREAREPDGPQPDRARRPEPCPYPPAHGADASDPRTAFGAGFSARGGCEVRRPALRGWAQAPCRAAAGGRGNLYGLAAVGRSVARCAPAARMGGCLRCISPLAEIEVSPFVPPLVAFAVSFFTSMGGISGAFLLLPFQMTFLGYTNTSVSATNQLYNVFSNPGGVFRYYREKRMLWPLSWIVMAGAVPGVVIGGLVRINWLADVRPFKLFVALVLLGIGLEMIRDLFGWMRFKPAPKYEQSPPKPYVEVVERNLSRVSYTFDGYLYSFSVPILLFYSIAVGLVGGIYGIGGGAIIAPFLVSVFHLPIYTVAGATLAATFVNALAGVLFYIAISPLYPDLSIAPDWGMALLLSLGGLLGMYFGAKFQKCISPVLLKWMLVVILFGTVIAYFVEFVRG